MIILIEAEKALDKIQHPAIKTLNKVGVERTSFSVILQAVYDKSTTKIILSGDEMRAVFLRVGTKQRCILLPFLFNIVLEILTRAIRQEKEIKGIGTGEVYLWLSLFVGDMILYSCGLVT